MEGHNQPFETPVNRIRKSSKTGFEASPKIGKRRFDGNCQLPQKSSIFDTFQQLQIEQPQRNTSLGHRVAFGQPIKEEPVFGMFLPPNVWPSERPIFGLFPPPKTDGGFKNDQPPTTTDEIDLRLRREAISYRIYRELHRINRQPIIFSDDENKKSAVEIALRASARKPPRVREVEVKGKAGEFPHIKVGKVPSLLESAKFVILDILVFKSIRNYTTDRQIHPTPAWLERNYKNEPVEHFCISLFHLPLYKPIPVSYMLPSTGNLLISLFNLFCFKVCKNTNILTN
jgi:hypothetical protein